MQTKDAGVAVRHFVRTSSLASRPRDVVYHRDPLLVRAGATEPVQDPIPKHQQYHRRIDLTSDLWRNRTCSGDVAKVIEAAATASKVRSKRRRTNPDQKRMSQQEEQEQS